MVRLPFTISSVVKMRKSGSTTNRFLLLSFTIFSGITLKSMKDNARQARLDKGEELLEAIKQVGGADQETIDRMAEIMLIKTPNPKQL